jgi:hypothetical protein
VLSWWCLGDAWSLRKARKPACRAEQRFTARKPLGVGGLPGTGKSLFAYYLAGEVSRRGDGVIYIGYEEKKTAAIRPRMDAVRAALHSTRVRDWEFASFPSDADGLEFAIRAHNVKLVVIDPLTNHLEASIYDAKQTRQALRPLEGIAERTGAAIVLFLHTIKRVSPNAHPIQAFPGAQGGLSGLVRAAFIFGELPDEMSVFSRP